jgi:hypothetical protein
MESGTSLSRSSEKLMRKKLAGEAAEGKRARWRGADKECDGRAVQRREDDSGERVGDLPAHVRASVVVRRGEYDARRLRSQREVIRDAMLAAAECDTWLTLGELRALTRYGEASISAQLRHLRKLENGGYEVAKRRREDAVPARGGAEWRGECLWEYHIVRTIRNELPSTSMAEHERSATS